MTSGAYLRGLAEFNREAFFEAHEALEEAWRDAPAGEKKFFQALVQLSVSLHHFRRGNLAGASSVMRRAGQNLAAYPDRFGGIDLAGLRRSVGEWLRALSEGAETPPLPKL